MNGWSSDEVIEAIELEDEAWVIGVQWHPERLRKLYDMTELFRVFIQQALERSNRI